MTETSRTLANDEPDVVSIAVRPGMVDTAVRVFLALLLFAWPSV